MTYLGIRLDERPDDTREFGEYIVRDMKPRAIRTLRGREQYTPPDVLVKVHHIVMLENIVVVRVEEALRLEGVGGYNHDGV